MKLEDLNYYRKRADEEVARAAAASRGDVRHIHMELAALYSARVHDTGRERRLHVVGE